MRKKRYFGRFVMFLLCAVFAVAFLLPTVLTITNSFMTESEIKANYGPVFDKDSKEGWRNTKHQDQWINTLRDYVFPVIGAKKVDAAMPTSTP